MFSKRGTWVRLLLPPALLAVVALGWSTGCATFGGEPAAAEMRTRAQASVFRDGTFHNAVHTPTGLQGDRLALLRDAMLGDQRREPYRPPPVNRLRTADLERAPASGLRLTWAGHSSFLIDIDGARVLTDPIWSQRCSPSSLVGPERFHAPPIDLDALPRLDAVIISHDHYDHLDHDTIVALARRGTRFYVPLGIGAHLDRWGVPDAQVVELDWWGEATIPGTSVKLVATPARHFSGRTLTDRNSTLWASWVVRGPTHRVYFGGDTGMFEGFRDIGARHGPFDATLMPIGAYNPRWAAVHLNPEEAVEAHRMVKGGLLLPIHWGTFQLALHGWNEPAERLLRAAAQHDVRVAVPQVGQPVEPARPPLLHFWWREYAPTTES